MQGPDSHEHLFFMCSFSSQVWSRIRHLAQMQHVRHNWSDIAGCLLQRGNSNSAKSVLGKLLVAAASYFIWQERNLRLFTNKVRPIEQLVDLIASTVRFKIVTLRFKNTNQVQRMIEDWNIPRNLVVVDDKG